MVSTMAVEPGRLRTDFGSAAPDAFWEILDLLEKAGATQLSVSSSAVEA